MQDAIYFVMKDSVGNVTFDEENLTSFCQDILRDIGRTESAFISYSVLQNLLLNKSENKFKSASTKEDIASSQFLLGKSSNILISILHSILTRLFACFFIVFLN